MSGWLALAESYNSIKTEAPALEKIKRLLQRKAGMTNRILAICLDCGDTLVDEGTEDKNALGVSLRADLIPGADAVMRRLKELEYPLALVADGPTATFTNNLGPHGLYDLFDVYAISEELGVSKPHPVIFRHALDRLGTEARKNPD